jgi:hypothetical protein
VGLKSKMYSMIYEEDENWQRRKLPKE